MKNKKQNDRFPIQKLKQELKIEETYQPWKRLHCPGQRHNVTHIYLLARDTVDGVISKMLRARDGATELFG